MLKTQKVAPLFNLLIVTFSWFYIIAYFNCVQKLLTIIVNMTAAMSVFEHLMLTVILASKLPDGNITLIVMKIIAWHLILLM